MNVPVVEEVTKRHTLERNPGTLLFSEIPLACLQDTKEAQAPKMEATKGRSSLMASLKSPEPEEQDNVDCKIEEQTYGSPTSSASPGHSPVDHPLNPLYPLTSANVGSSFGYSRASDRWQETVGTTRTGTPALQGQEIWPLSPSSSHTHIGGSRRESGGLPQNESWISTGLQSERSRARSSNPYQNAMAMRDHDSLPGLTTRYNGSRTGRDLGSQRLPWMMSPDTSDRDSRSSHSRSSFSSSSSSSSLPFAEGYQSYSSSWSGNDHGIDIPTSQTPFSPNHQGYSSSYATGSGELYNIRFKKEFSPTSPAD
ncbi:hypothetical protein HHX47_DHR7000583 [Lentinula edodes]|nr:hypothetical protein HHX47_DHR7000583 [Lentinula edodes]